MREETGSKRNVADLKERILIKIMAERNKRPTK
jgi:hypothetical protein